jgi:hypothetical protein
MDQVEARLRSKFDVKRAADNASFVGMKRVADLIMGAVTIHQQQYIEEFLVEFGMTCAAQQRSDLLMASQMQTMQAARTRSAAPYATALHERRSRLVSQRAAAHCCTVHCQSRMHVHGLQRHAKRQ